MTRGDTDRFGDGARPSHENFAVVFAISLNGVQMLAHLLSAPCAYLTPREDLRRICRCEVALWSVVAFEVAESDGDVETWMDEKRSSLALADVSKSHAAFCGC